MRHYSHLEESTSQTDPSMETVTFPPENPVPVIVTTVPPAVPPRSGLTDDTLGVRSDRKVKAEGPDRSVH